MDNLSKKEFTRSLDFESEVFTEIESGIRQETKASSEIRESTLDNEITNNQSTKKINENNYVL